MRLKRLTAFLSENIEADSRGKKPHLSTVKRWPGAHKLGGEWYINMDQYEDYEVMPDKLAEIKADPEVARLLQ